MEIGLPEIVVIIFILLLAYFLLVRQLGEKKKRSQDFGAVLGDDTKAAAPDGKGNIVIVDLPEGVFIQDVEALLIGKKPGKLKVTLNHEAIDRRNIPFNNNDNMDI